ncbi:MAG: selenite/tellurite reduction operon rhodanese-like protein ExtH [Trichloromonas sp.]|nr:selenite/tellurite reduction operon rhodanese-like protein ExtH [Trichloromonas sp.]
MKRIFSEMKSLRYALLAFAATALLLGGCSGGGGSDYDAPESVTSAPIVGQTQSVLIDAPTLKSWVDAGYVNSNNFDNHVVILHTEGAADNTKYLNGHISGAQVWNTTGVDRIEGPVLSGNMVLDGDSMNALLESHGIRKNSTIVFTGDNNLARIYFLFRYWNFPKSQLKILNGSLAAWRAYGYPLTNVAPNIDTTNCVRVQDLAPGPNTEVRASLSEAIEYVREGTVTPYNTFAATFATTPTITETLDGVGPDAVGTGMSGYVLFQGEMLGAVHDHLVAGLKTTENINGINVPVFKSAADMRTFLEVEKGIDLSKPIMTYCRAGNLASQGFAPIDAVLGDEVRVMMYDGSWSQWGTLTNDRTVVPTGYTWVLPNGQDGLLDYTAWATDVLTTDITYLKNYVGTITWGGVLNTTFDPTKHIQPPYFYVAPGSPAHPDANNIENDDIEYFEGGSRTAPSSTTGTAGGC